MQQTRSGINVPGLDTTIRPQDDLYLHVNNTWISHHEIPADRSMDGAFTTLRDLSEERVRDIIQDLSATDNEPGSTNAKVGDLYTSFMDTERIEALGITPIAQNSEAINAATSPEEFARVIGSLQRTVMGGAVSFYVDNDAKDPEVYKVQMLQGGLGLPDEAYYREEQHAEIRAAYLPHIARMLTLAGAVTSAEEASAAADSVMALETKIASHHWDVVAERDAVKAYNPMTLGELVDLAPGYPWKEWIAGLGSSEATFDALVIHQPSFFTGLGELWQSEPLTDWKLWAQYRLISSSAAFLTDELVEASFDFYGRTLSGAQEVKDRWKRGVALVEGCLGEAVGQEYVARHFPATHKARMDELVANLVEAYRESITALEWMGEETKVRAIAKLEKFTPKIGYPVKWRDYSALEITPDDLYGNVVRSNIADNAKELDKVGKPIDRDEWFMFPQTVNAYYNPGMNEIVFPAAILQPPFFDAEADDAVNYGGIGGVIGHEIGHGFDDQGAKYDGDGRLEDWWTAEDLTAFEERTRALIDQYDAFIPAQFGGDGPHVNGALTIGENIGDLGGLAITLKAYRIALEKLGLDGFAEAPVMDGFTGLQRVFLNWAKVWESKGRDEELKRRIASDPHSPNEFRCNGVVPNVPEFYEAFNVQDGDALYYPPQNRVHIW
ncbi:MAG: peptidase M13 [Cellulomonadaceae bacterium]|jgi:putative endopeptidase|nr:peptidase M13 [Cellulomonadaceae bacterium]